MSSICFNLNESSMSPRDVLCAFKLLKAGKSDGSYGLVSDQLRNG